MPQYKQIIGSSSFTCLELVKALVPSLQTGEKFSDSRWGKVMSLPITSQPTEGDIVLWCHNIWLPHRGWVEFIPQHIAMIVNAEEGLLIHSNGWKTKVSIWQWKNLYNPPQYVKVLHTLK